MAGHLAGTERGFQRSLRDVRLVGARQAVSATRALVRRKRRFSIRNRAMTITQAFDNPIERRAPVKSQSLLAEIAGGLFKTAKGEATFPIPGVGMAGRALQVRAIGRQQLARVPLPVKILGGAVGATALTEAVTGQSPIPLARDLLFGAGERAGRALQGRRGAQKMGNGRLAVGQELPPSHLVVRVWQTFPGGPRFARMADGHIAVEKKDGTIKHFRPYRPVVIPRRWNARSMSRVATALKRQRKTATKIMQITGGMPKGRK